MPRNVGGTGSPGRRLALRGSAAPPRPRRPRPAASRRGLRPAAGPRSCARLRLAIRPAPAQRGQQVEHLARAGSPGCRRADGLGPAAQGAARDQADQLGCRRPRRPGARPRARTAAMATAGGVARWSSRFIDTCAMPGLRAGRGPGRGRRGGPPPDSRTRAAMARASVSVPSGSQTFEGDQRAARTPTSTAPAVGCSAVRAGVGHHARPRRSARSSSSSPPRRKSRGRRALGVGRDRAVAGTRAG